MLNDLGDGFYKRATQMITYAPHFISTVVLCSITILFLNRDTGVINTIIRYFGGTGDEWMAKSRLFAPIYVIGTRPKAVGLNREVRSGSVIPLSDLPEFCSGCESAHVEPASSMLRCLRYKGGDYELTYLLNESAEPWEGMVKFSVAPGHSVYRYDAWDNCCYKFDRDKKMCLEPSKGCLLIADENDTLLCEAYEAPANALELTEFERSVCKATDYPTFKNPKKVTLPDLLEQELPDFGGFVRYQTRIDCLELPLKPVWLEIEGAQEGIEVFVNGDSLGIQIVPVYRFELADKLKLGINDIVIEQATTLERVVPRRDGKPAENHVGINSRIVIRYSDGTFAKE